MEGFGTSLEDLYGRTPDRSDEDTPAHIQVYNALCGYQLNFSAYILLFQHQ